MRRRRPEKRTILPDPIFNDVVVAKFVNYIMKGGKKSVAEKNILQFFRYYKSKSKNRGTFRCF